MGKEIKRNFIKEGEDKGKFGRRDYKVRLLNQKHVVEILSCS